MNELRAMPGSKPDPDLAPFLMDPDPRIVKRAARRIGLTRDTRYVQDLIRCLARADENVPEEDVIIDEGLESLKLIGEGAFDPLVALTDDPDERIRCTAIECLGAIGCARAVVPLCEALGNPGVRVKVSALQSLAWLGVVTEDVEKQVVSCLHDSRSEVQLEAVEACGELGLQRAVPVLITRLDPIVRSVRDVIIPALGKIGDPRAVEPLVECLDTVIARNPFDPLIVSITDALGKIRDPRAIRPQIMTLKKVIDAYYSRLVQEAGEDCSCTSEPDSSCGSCSADDYADRYEQVETIKQRLMASLIHAGEASVGPLIRILSQVIREPVTPPLRLQPPRYRRRYYSTSDEIFIECCIVILTNLGSPVIEPALELLHDENARVRAVGCSILAPHLSDEHVREALVATIIAETEDQVRSSAMKALASFHPCTFDRFAEAVSYRHLPLTCEEQNSIHRIARLAMQDLVHCLGDPDEQKRSRSLAVIAQFVNAASRECPDEGIPGKKAGRYSQDVCCNWP